MAYEQRFMDLVIEAATKNARSGDGGPFAALIVKDSKIIGQGSNSVTKLHDPSAHAEVQAIREACKNLSHFEIKDCELYSSCEPCPMCLGAIYWSRPSAVYFAADKMDAAAGGFDDDFIYQEINKDLGQRKIPFKKMKHPNSTLPFEEWIKNPKKVSY